MKGISQTVKNVLSPESKTEPAPDVNPSDLNPRSDLVNDPTQLTNSNRAARLPSGTGVGTSGKGARSSVGDTGRLHPTETAVRHDAERVRSSRDISGYGTDAAAATGGDLSTTHQASSHLDSTQTRGQSLNMTTVDEDYDRERIGTKRLSEPTVLSSGTTERRLERDSRGEFGHAGVLEREHVHGHTKHNPKETMPTGNAVEDTNQLNPVVHEHVRHLEREEVAHVMDHERHIHHIQHHVQPIIASEELAEEHREKIAPVTHITETHANKPEDRSIFDNQIHQYRNTLQHDAKERTIIDKGTTVKEHVHHHIHHVIQPIIEKETIERENIHTTIPIHEVTHEAPVIHQSQTHAPVPMEHFISRGGTLHGAVSQDQIQAKVLHTGQCTREVEGLADNLEGNLNIRGDETLGHTHTHTHVRESDVGDLAAKKAAAARAERGGSLGREIPVEPRTRD